jgi:hypothetical protein
MPSVAAAKSALKTLLDARDELDGALVQFGLPAKLPVPMERVYIRGARNWTRRYSVEQGGFEETYDLPVLVEVDRAGDDHDGTADRMWDIVAAIDDTLRTNEGLNWTVRQAFLAGADEDTNVSSQTKGWLSKGFLTVRVQAFT